MTNRNPTAYLMKWREVNPFQHHLNQLRWYYKNREMINRLATYRPDEEWDDEDYGDEGKSVEGSGKSSLMSS